VGKSIHYSLSEMLSMMRTKLAHEPDYIALIQLEQGKLPRESNVLAAMTLYEGTGCWKLVDIRLSRHRNPSQYSGSLPADVLAAAVTPKTDTERDFVKANLREYREEPDGSITWCTFDGIVRGSPKVKGCAPVTYFDQAGYFSRADGLAILKLAQEEWESYPEGAGFPRLHNPNRQHHPMDLFSAFRMQDLVAKTLSDQCEKIASLKSSAGTAYILWKHATAAIRQVGDPSLVDWAAVDRRVVREAVVESRQPIAEVAKVVREFSASKALLLQAVVTEDLLREVAFSGPSYFEQVQAASQESTATTPELG
jgi:hypothetical protein